MSTVSRAQRARNIALEVASYRLDYGERRRPIAEDLDFSWSKPDSDGVSERRRSVGSLAFTALGHSHAVIRQADRHILPRGRVAALTRRTLAVTALAGTSLRPELDDELDNCCLGAELKFVHGLEYHGLGKQPDPDHDAALILHDAQGEPFAYQKAVGEPNAYVWRDGLMRTRAGLRQLSAGSIVVPIYDRDSKGRPPPQEKFAGAGLVGITGCVADDVVFMRFSLEVFPERIRSAGLLDASVPGAYEDYRYHVKEARGMNSAVFADCMTELVKNTKSYNIT